MMISAALDMVNREMVAGVHAIVTLIGAVAPKGTSSRRCPNPVLQVIQTINRGEIP